MVLPVNLDTTYADSGSDASVKAHQQHHDTVHAAVNGLATTYLAADSSAATDGQLFAWSTALGHAVPVAATGAAEAAYAENATGTATGPVAGVSGGFGTAVAISGTDITVTNSNGRPVYLDAFALLQQTTAGTGVGLVEVWETTGTPAVFYRGAVPLPNSTAANTGGRVEAYVKPARLGAITTTRTFQIKVNCYGVGATPAVSALNTNAVGFKSWLRALSY